MAFEKISKYTNEQFIDICGLDEAGRGPWAGPVFAAAVMSYKEPGFHHLNDSKLLSEKQRRKLYEKITSNCFYGVGMATNKEIDHYGLIKAVNLAFERAIKDLINNHPELHPKILLIDGRDKLKLPYKYKSIVKGDQKIKLISCASIIAKVERDIVMTEMHLQYPHYLFQLHKGYGTKIHQKNIHKYGPCPIHRLSYKPLLPYIKDFSNKT